MWNTKFGGSVHASEVRPNVQKELRKNPFKSNISSLLFLVFLFFLIFIFVFLIFIIIQALHRFVFFQRLKIKKTGVLGFVQFSNKTAIESIDSTL